MNEMARKQANLRLLQRSDKGIADILGSATHVVLYNFQQSSGSWQKSNVEGSLFLAVRQAGYVLLILNRNSPENYQVAVSRDFQLQNKDPYLIFKQEESGQTVIRGIWFPNSQERITVNNMLNQVLAQLRSAPAAAQQQQQVQQPAQPVQQVQPTAPAPTAATASPDNAAVAAATLGALLSPEALGTNTNGALLNGVPASSPTRQASGTGPTLDKKSLQLALLSLIQDERFLDLLHAQYLKVAHARAHKPSK
uniref:mRNA-decapping enzyme C-terminal domain-containing protein n=1 Tax=Craspedostauros australis TaxID=1486917 RepID=A0A7R9WPS0_9STRA|mmetsp:Transcript_13545/g.37336  ORF Transcript_13545/g.37336 Transcript_13545/m.37336 type:complete len:252 (+) Transcript_13545:302-1057(+)|eukprot:CAMPEP_0198118446 /NCGR_PEP_ID=MMETSP1442-20131203/21709_1 /TAXON_ID= /ORGANISM="Craspedostauros australis, Strain CCMP3328" /LENGTH=251 /DNA_ID=CAMNT_0043776705 /DNA_START=210 /DNA_END=965 /DNA_ORIENTATION=-